MSVKTYKSLRRFIRSGYWHESLREKQSRFVRLVTLLLIEADRLGYEVTFGDAYATTGHMNNSLHYKRLAIDLNLFKKGKYLTETSDHALLGQYWESLGGAWGGRFEDGNHYSLKHKGKR